MVLASPSSFRMMHEFWIRRGGGMALRYPPLRCSCCLRRQQQRRRYHELSYDATNRDPTAVLRYRQSHADRDNDNAPPTANIPLVVHSWMRVQMEAAPWNPADAQAVQGRYPLPPPVVMPYDYNDNDDDELAAHMQQAYLRENMATSRYFDGCTVAGAQGIGRVTDVVPTKRGLDAAAPAASFSPFQPGDWVTVGIPFLGTLRSSLWVPLLTPVAKNLDVTKEDIPVLPLPFLPLGDTFQTALHMAMTKDRGGDESRQIATARYAALFQLAGTALRMLQDFVSLEHQDNDREPLVVLQNAGNSGVGSMVAQCMAHFYPQHVLVSLVRRGERSEEQAGAMVQNLAASHSHVPNGNANNHIVLVEEDFLDDKEALRSIQKDLAFRSTRPPVLALNAVGGASAALLLKLLLSGSQSSSSSYTTSSQPPPTMVTYGGMAGSAGVTVGTGQLIFQNAQLAGYWHSRWMVDPRVTASGRQQAMVDTLLQASMEGLSLPLVDVVPLADYETGWQRQAHQSQQDVRRKLVFDLTEESSAM